MSHRKTGHRTITHRIKSFFHRLAGWHILLLRQFHWSYTQRKGARKGSSRKRSSTPGTRRHYRRF